MEPIFPAPSPPTPPEEPIEIKPDLSLEQGGASRDNKDIFIDDWEPERPLPLNESSRRILLRMTLDRITNVGADSHGGEGVWATLLARLVARGMQGFDEEEIEDRREDVRRALFSFIVTDFHKR